jgi:DNA repair exonuclease SbcCD ATPase subunit
VIHNLEHEVEASIDFDNRLIVLKKVLTEKWTKKRGNPIAEMTGHETNHFIDGVPKSLSEYKAFIDMIISESISRTITDPMYFNIVMPWKNRRELLFQLVGIQEEIEIANNSPEEIRSTIVSIINQGKSIEDEKKRIAVEKRRLNDVIEQIPSRIDEVNRSMKEVPDISIEQLKTQDNILKNEESKLIEQIENENKKFEEANSKNRSIQNEVFKLETELQEKQNDYTKANRISKQTIQESIDSLTSRKNSIKRQIDDVDSEIRLKEHSLKLEKETKEKLLSLYHEENKRTFEFDESSCKCPMCSTPFGPEQIKEKGEEAFKVFDATKLSNLARIKNEGTQITLKIEKLEEDLKNLNIQKVSFANPETIEKEIQDLKVSLENVKDIDLETIPELIEFKKQIDAKRSELTENKIQDNTEIKELIQEVKNKMEEVKTKLSIYSHNENASKRIDELKAELRTLNQEKADLEQIEFKLETFVQFKIKNIEEKINNSFKIVNFKMFNELLNGGFEETCICTVDGVSFKNLNNELKVNAGLDIIQTLQKFFNISAPIFIDNRESVSDIIVNDEVQIINLVVDVNCKQLTQK